MIEILEYIVEYGINLEPWNLAGFAFQKTKALELLDLFSLNNIWVIGGELMKIENNYVDVIYMNWSIDSSFKSSQETILYARNYINKYMNDDEFVNFVTDKPLYHYIEINNIKKKSKISTLLKNLVDIEKNFEEVLINIYESDWNRKSDVDIILSVKNILNVLNLCYQGKITKKNLEDWIELIELREDIIYENKDKEFITIVMNELKNIDLEICNNLIVKINKRLDSWSTT